MSAPHSSSLPRAELIASLADLDSLPVPSHRHPVADLHTTGTPSSSTFLNGSSQWAVPVNTVYALLTQAVVEAGTAVTSQTINAAVLKGAIQKWVTGSYTVAVSAIGQGLAKAADAAAARTVIGAASPADVAAVKSEILGGVGPAFDTLAELKTEYEGADANLTALIGGKLDKAPGGTPSTQYLNGSGGYSTPPNATYSGMQAVEAEDGSSLMDKIISPSILKGAIQRWVTGSTTTAVSAIGRSLNQASSALAARTTIGAEQEGWQGTTAAYNQLAVKDPNRNYYLTD